MNEVGVGGGRSYSALIYLLSNLGITNYSYRGYDISKVCINYLINYYGPNFELSAVDNPKYRKCDLLYFFDVIVHAAKPLDFLDAVSESCTKYLCFQSPTRDTGATEYDVAKSCKFENGSWIPWIIFNVDELVEQLRKRGFIKVLMIKRYKNFGGTGMRYLPCFQH